MISHIDLCQCVHTSLLPSTRSGDSGNFCHGMLRSKGIHNRGRKTAVQMPALAYPAAMAEGGLVSMQPYVQGAC